MEVFSPFRTFDERHLNLSREQSFKHLICIPAASRDSDLRVCPPKSSHERWQEIYSDRLRGSQSELARMLPKRRCHRGKCFVREVLHPLCTGEQRLSAGRQSDPSPAAIE